jgi:predicted ATPase with chaperone activity
VTGLRPADPAPKHPALSFPAAVQRVRAIEARTIADLAAAEQIATAHVAGALQYRPRVAES